MPGQRRDVDRLLVDLVVHVAQQRLARVDHRRHAHRALARDLPLVVGRASRRGSVPSSHVHHALRDPARRPRARRAASCRSRPSPRPPDGAAPRRPARPRPRPQSPSPVEPHREARRTACGASPSRRRARSASRRAAARRPAPRSAPRRARSGRTAAGSVITAVSASAACSKASASRRADAAHADVGAVLEVLPAVHRPYRPPACAGRLTCIKPAPRRRPRIAHGRSRGTLKACSRRASRASATGPPSSAWAWRSPTARWTPCRGISRRSCAAISASRPASAWRSCCPTCCSTRWRSPACCAPGLVVVNVNPLYTASRARASSSRTPARRPSWCWRTSRTRSSTRSPARACGA